MFVYDGQMYVRPSILSHWSLPSKMSVLPGLEPPWFHWEWENWTCKQRKGLTLKPSFSRLGKSQGQLFLPWPPEMFKISVFECVWSFPLPHHASCSYFEMLGRREKTILQIGRDDHNILWLRVWVWWDQHLAPPPPQDHLWGMWRNCGSFQPHKVLRLLDQIESCFCHFVPWIVKIVISSFKNRDVTKSSMWRFLFLLSDHIALSTTLTIELTMGNIFWAHSLISL